MYSILQHLAVEIHAIFTLQFLKFLLMVTVKSLRSQVGLQSLFPLKERSWHLALAQS